MNASVNVGRGAVTALRRAAERAGMTAFAGWLENHSALVGKLFASALVPDWSSIEDALVAEPRTAAKRRDANVAALRLLGAAKGAALKDTERSVLLRYSGWGGVIGRRSDVLTIPADVRPDDWRGLIDEYYTPLSLAQEVWRLLARLRAQGVIDDDPRCLEPSAGIGRFLESAPEGLDWTTVELSDESGEILQTLYPEVDHSPGAFQTFATSALAAGEQWDVIVGNPPYAKQGVFARGPWKRAHSYFLATGVDLLAPGGVLGYIIPLGVVSGTDRESRKLRRYLLTHADLLGAYALAGDTFPGAKLGLAFVLLRRRSTPNSAPHEGYLAGDYFRTVGGLQNLGGTWASEKEGKTYREMIIASDGARPLSEMVLVVDGSPASSASKKKPMARTKTAARRVSPEDVSKLAEHHQRALKLGGRIRKFRATRLDAPAASERLRLELSGDLAEWVGRHGIPHDDEVLTAMVQPDAEAFVSAFDADGALVKLFVEEAPDTEPFPYDRNSLADVVKWLSGRSGQASWSECQQLYTGPYARMSDFVRALKLPGNGDVMIAAWSSSTPWVDEDMDRSILMHRREYLSGDLYRRIDVIDAQLKDESTKESVVKRLLSQREALIERINPLPIDAIDVDFRHGLVPADCLSDWLTEMAGETITAAWEDGLLLLTGPVTADIEEIAAFASRQETFASAKATKKKRRHQRDLDLQERLSADQKLLNDFNDWLRASEHWGPHVADLYNRAYRSHVPRPLDGEQVPIARAASDVELRAHQNNAIRGLTEMRGGIVGHDVGLGKTFTAVGLVGWWRQLQLARRPIVVVPKQVITNWVREFQRLLPDYALGTIGVQWSDRLDKWVEDGPEAKRAKWQSFASGQYDCLVVTQPAFEALPTRPDTRLEGLRSVVWLRREEKLVDREKAYLERRITSLKFQVRMADTEPARQRLEKTLKSSEDALERYLDRGALLDRKVQEAQDALAENTDPGSTKLLEKRLRFALKAQEKEQKAPSLRMLEAAEQEFEQWSTKTEFERQKDLGLTWEELGCDLIILDEAHAYKNLFKPETRYGQSIKYLGSGSGGSECKRCWDLLIKTKYLREHNDGGGVVLLTATPLKNSPLELYNLLLYTRPQLLESRGIRSHEEFVDRYCGFKSALVLDSGQELKESLIVDRFINLPELRSLMDLVVDMRTADDVGLDVPKTKTQMITLPMDGYQEETYDLLRQEGRAARLPDSDDNILAVLRRMDYAALDLRLLDEDRYGGGWGESYEPPKYVELAERILQSRDCAHIVFVSESRRESLDRCKALLVAFGMAPERIVTMHGGVKQGDRQRIVDGLNGVYERVDGVETLITPPKYDVIIGNSVMSEGLNLQRRACSIHHIDIPWTPSDLQQRNGRGVRQGNAWAVDRPVGIYYYLTERSSDGYRLQLVTGKRGWMDTLLKSSDSTAANPLAESGLSEDDLILLFADDPESAKAELAARRKAAEEKRLVEAKKGARMRFFKLQLFWARARNTTDEGLARNYARQATQVERVLRETDEAVFPAKLKELLHEVREHGVYVSPKGHILREGTVVPNNGAESLVYKVDPVRKKVTYRLLGEPCLKTAAYTSLDETTATPPETPLVWRADEDIARFEKTLSVTWSRVKPWGLPSMAPELMDTWWDRYAENAAGSYVRNLDVPVVLNGRVEVVEWNSVSERLAAGWKLMRPDEPSWELFLAAEMSATTRNRVARRWWGRAAPKPDTDTPQTKESTRAA